ncbi:MAG: hypothetical protein RSB69_11570 [Odoribacter sp.]
MKNKIIIVGTGAVAAEITSMIEDSPYGEIANIEIKGYLEYSYNVEKYYKKYKFINSVLGDVDNYLPIEEDYFVIGVADISFRKKLIDILESKNAKFINIIHHTAIIARTAHLGKGNLINPNCMVGPNAVLGNFNLLTSGSMISHDCIVGNNNVFSTGLLCGHVIIGNDNNFGVRGTVIPHISIGDRNIVQAGMIVDKDVLNDTTVFHRFKEKVLAIPKIK